MQTTKLYYDDCHLQSFTARVTGCEKTRNGYAVTLDSTAFYPEGGGQACDMGTLGNARVLDVREQGETVIHLCDGPLSPGETVEGHIDYARRFDLMQQHTGEHIVSGIIFKRFGYHNVGFHMGADMIQIDFDGPIPAQALPEIELEANQAVWADLPIQCWHPEKGELSQISYRTKRALPWPVRIVQIGNVDTCACCGIHTGRTGEVGLIKIFSCTKFHQGVRLEMCCGQRALNYLSQVLEQNRQVSQSFSSKMLETGAAAQRISAQLAAEKFRAAGLEKQLYDSIAKGYTGHGNVLHFAQGLSPAGVRELAEKIASCCQGVAAVFSGEAGRYDVCLARPGSDVKALGTAMSETLNGRGGGKPGFFQGSIRADAEDIHTFFRRQWESS